MIEIERTFTVKKIPQNLKKFKSEEIKQGYIVSADSMIRLRQVGSKFELTKKFRISQSDFSRHQETTVELTKEEFEKLWTLVDGFVEKTRYFIPIGGKLVAELDVFEGDLKGLVIVDVEFDTAEEMVRFKPLDWFGKDITQQEETANKFLAGKKYAEVEKFFR